MADVVNAKLIVLWDEEIRDAARKLKVAIELSRKLDRSEEEEQVYSVRVIDAVAACISAIGGADDDQASLVLAVKRGILFKEAES